MKPRGLFKAKHRGLLRVAGAQNGKVIFDQTADILEARGFLVRISLCWVICTLILQDMYLLTLVVYIRCRRAGTMYE